MCFQVILYRQFFLLLWEDIQPLWRPTVLYNSSIYQVLITYYMGVTLQSLALILCRLPLVRVSPHQDPDWERLDIRTAWHGWVWENQVCPLWKSWLSMTTVIWALYQRPTVPSHLLQPWYICGMSSVYSKSRQPSLDYLSFPRNLHLRLYIKSVVLMPVRSYMLPRIDSVVQNDYIEIVNMTILLQKSICTFELLGNLSPEWTSLGSAQLGSATSQSTWHMEGGQPVLVKWIAEIKAQFYEIRVLFTGHSYVFSQ